MIRADKAIKGIPIPGPDGMLATHATRLASKGDALTDRGLVDDTMIALASRESSRFDPSPGEAPLYSKSGPPVERRLFCEVM